MACRDAGFPRGALTHTKGGSSQGLTYAMDEVNCTGIEEHLIHCQHSLRADCGPNEAAGAVCDSVTEEDLQEQASKVDECYASGVSFSLKDQIGQPFILSTAVQCQCQCLENPDCLQFSFSMNHTKECLLFSVSIKVPHPYHVGGPRNCQVNDQPMSCPGEDQMREKQFLTLIQVMSACMVGHLSWREMCMLGAPQSVMITGVMRRRMLCVVS